MFVRALMVASLRCFASFVTARMLVAKGVVANSLEQARCRRPASVCLLHLHLIWVFFSLPMSRCLNVVESLSQ